MLILGAGGHAKEMLELIPSSIPHSRIAIFDNVTPISEIPQLFLAFNIIRDEKDLKKWFLNINNDFLLGVGGLKARRLLYTKGIENGGNPLSIKADNASVGNFDTSLGKGTTIMQYCFISNSVTIGECVLINARANIHHDVHIADFCEIGPGAILLGKSTVGVNTFIGSGAIILPNVNIGSNCIIGAGTIVTKNIPDNLTVKGNPGR